MGRDTNGYISKVILMYSSYYGKLIKNLFYANEWPTVAREIKDACNWRCQECDKQCRRPGEFYLGWEYELTVAHYDGDYESAEIFVTALCVVCHLRHDAPFVWVARRRHERGRRLRAGQLELLTR